MSSSELVDGRSRTLAAMSSARRMGLRASGALFDKAIL